jgi:hypothetical protein
MMVTEMKRDGLAMAKRSLDTILDVVRHMQYYIAPWQDLDLEQEAAILLGGLFESREDRVFRHLLAEDPIFGSQLALHVGGNDHSRLPDLTKDFDLVHESHLAQTLTLAIRSMKTAIREEQNAYIA